MEPYPEPIQTHLLPSQRPESRPASPRRKPRRHDPLPALPRLQFRRAPLAAAALALAAGIALARTVYQPISVLAGAAAVLLLLTWVALRWAGRVAPLPALAIWCVLGLLAAQNPPPPAHPLTLQPFTDGLSRDLTATVLRIRPLPPESPTQTDVDAVPPWEATWDETRKPASAGPVLAANLALDLAIDHAEQLTPDISTMVPAAGGVRMTLYTDRTPAPALACGDRVAVTLRLRPLERYRDPGAWQYADYLAAHGITARGSTGAEKLMRLGPGPPALSCRLAAAQTWASARLQAFVAFPQNARLPPLLRLAPADAGMVAAMLFGDRTGLDGVLRTSFERTGSFHLFVVSGVHIALLAGLVFWCAHRLRTPDWLATLLALPAAAAYAAFTGFGAPAQRSLAMVAVYLLARLLSRDRDPLNALGAAALVMLLWAPSLLFDAGFQMTLLAVVAIAGLAHPMAQRLFRGVTLAARSVFSPRRNTLPPRLAQLRMILELLGESLAEALNLVSANPVRKLPALLVRLAVAAAELVLIGIVAELVMVLPMAVYFHRATLFALPANMLVIPLIGLLAPAAVLTFAAALLSPWLAIVPGACLALLLHGVTAAVLHLGRLPSADLRIPGPAPAVALVAVTLWLIGCWAVRQGRRPTLLTALALPLITAAILWPEPALTTPGALEITALDVGQGDSLLAVNPAGQTMLIDAGGPIGSHGSAEVISRFDVGEQIVSPYLWFRRMRRLDIVVLTHAHTDHMGGMPAILRNFRPRELWVSADPHSPLFTQLLAEAASLGVRVRHLHTGDHMEWGAVAVDVLSPDVAYTNPDSPRNDDSLVLHLGFGKASALLEGDAERPSEQRMLATGAIRPVTLLKVGHHGSNTSTTPEFLAAADPREAILSAGAGNPFGHPRAEVVGRFAARGTPLYRTDRTGLTTFLLTPDGGIHAVIPPAVP